MADADVWPAPAKLNLFLHVTGRRDDGYHLLQTVFQFVDYCDELTFSLRKDARIERTGSLDGVSPDDDLTVRAAKALQERCHVDRGVDINLRKRIPMGAGLGGGSSDAATTLVALNHLWRLGLSDTELAAIGVELGADVPVFVLGHAAWGEGIGDRLEPVELPEPWFVVVTPPCHVSTPEVFADPDLTRNARPIKIRNFLSGEGSNACEPVVRRRYPLVDEAIKWLNRFGQARMSGTGASVFVQFDEPSVARRVLTEVPAGWSAFMAQGRNVSPLRALVSRSS